jgi:HK97 family phage major capsid protein
MPPIPQGARGRQTRLAAIERRTVDADQRTVELAFSSEEPVERFWGIEILGHDRGEIDESWIGSGTAPLLMDHNPRDQIGVVESVTLGADRKMRAVVRFGRSARAEEVMQDVADGIRGNVSVGYELLDVALEREEKGQPPVYRARRWKPLEVSLVAVPADLTVGVGREAVAEPAPPIIQPNPESPPAPPAAKEARMEPETTETKTRAAPPPAHVLPSAADHAEERRRKDIMDLAALANQRELGVDAVIAGETIEVFRGKLAEARRGHARPLGPPPSELGMSKEETKRYSLFRAMRAAAEKDWSDAGLELEAHRELEKRLGAGKGKRSFYVPLEVQERPALGMGGQRDLSAVTGSAGGFLVATNNMSFIEVLRARSVSMRMGAQTMSGLVGNVTVPRQTGAGTAVWLANETTAATEGDQAFSQMSLSPKNVAAYTEVSRQLMLQSSPGAEMVVTNDLAAVVALAVDAAGISGTGAAGQPTGIVNTGGIGSFSGTTIGLPGILEAQTDVLTGNALLNPAASGYVATPAVAGLLAQRQRFTSTDTPLWEGNLMDGTVSGFPAMSSTQMPASRILFGDWSQLVIGEWGTLEIDVNPYANFPAGITGIRAFYTVDVGVRYAASFSYSTAVT